MRNDDLAAGIFGTIHLELDGVARSYQNVLLRFEPISGVVLEWTQTENLPDTLALVTGQFSIGRIAVRDLRYAGMDVNSGGARIRYRANAMDSSTWLPSVVDVEVTEVFISVPMLHEYMRRQPVVGLYEEVNEQRSWHGYSAQDINVPVGGITAMAAMCALNVYAEGKGEPGLAWTITPVPRVDLRFNQPVPLNDQRAAVMKVRAFMEILMYRVNTDHQIQFRDLTAHIIKHRFVLGQQSQPKEVTSPWELPFSLCEAHIAVLLNSWLERFADSREVDYLMRLLHYSNLPIDMRFFMAFTALGILNVNTTEGLNPKSKLPQGEVGHLRMNLEAWKVLVPDRDESSLDRYFTRIANTRHDIAHLSREHHEVIRNDRDKGRAMMQLVSIARSRLFEHMGLPSAQVNSYLEVMATKLRGRFHEVPDELFL